MVSNFQSVCNPRCWAETFVSIDMPNLSSLGKICGSNRGEDMVVMDRAKRKNSVRRMSIIEDGQIAEVLYLIPKQSMMEQLPFLNPNDYILCERMVGMPPDMGSIGPVGHVQDPAEKLCIQCYKCGEPCKGEVLRVQYKHFHIKCFTCKVCGCDLAQGGFFMKNGDYLCTLDYQRLHGTCCNGCGSFVEGEVVTALGKTYHPACFVCTICKRPFPTGDRVTFNGKDCLCQHCIHPMSPTPKDISSSSRMAPPIARKTTRSTLGFSVRPAISSSQGRFWKQVTSITIPVVQGAADATTCSQKERKCTCKDLQYGIQTVRTIAELKRNTGAIELIPEADPKHCRRRRGIQSGLLVQLRRRAHYPSLPSI
nr:actin-binding LIM protein 1 isoform X3 [Oncorhynchus nerka]